MAGRGCSDIVTGYDDRDCFSARCDLRGLDYRLDKEPQRFEMDMTTMPNKSPEPTAVGHRSSAVAAHVVSRRWLSFFR